MLTYPLLHELAFGYPRWAWALASRMGQTSALCLCLPGRLSQLRLVVLTGGEEGTIFQKRKLSPGKIKPDDKEAASHYPHS